MQWFRVDLKAFYAWLCLTNAVMLSQSKYLVLGGIFWQETPNLNTPYIRIVLSYSTVVLYIGIMKVYGFWPKIITPKPA